MVGGGPAGVAAALTGARLGASVTLIERSQLGGTCVHAGCIPAGVFHWAIAVRDAAARAAGLGVLAGTPALDWERMQSWASSVVRTAASITRAALEHAGVQILAGSARFIGPGRLEAGRTFEGSPIVIATGAVSAAPELSSATDGRVVTNDDVMALGSVPASLVVWGCGRFSIEWADLFASLGSRVTVVAPEQRILPEEDAEIAGFLQLVLEERGLRFLLGTKIDQVVSAKVLAGGETIDASAILSADTRVPRVEGLRLAAAGLDVGEHGGIMVDSYGRTPQPLVFAAGDVTGPPWLSNRARAQGVAAATVALGGSVKVRPERLPRSVNTHPELAAIGLTEEQATARGLGVAVGFAELATNLRAVTLGESKGALKLVVEREFGEILGAHMVGVGAVEVIAQVAAAIELEADYRSLARIYHLHPSLGELVTEAVASI